MQNCRAVRFGEIPQGEGVAKGGQDFNVIGFLGDDSLGYLALAPHGVQGYDATLETQNPDQFRECGGLIALGVHRPLAGNDPIFGAEGAQEVQGRLFFVYGGP